MTTNTNPDNQKGGAGQTIMALIYLGGAIYLIYLGVTLFSH
jgi:threonine/homoserine/homoserine lactone efflux protein